MDSVTPVKPGTFVPPTNFTKEDVDNNLTVEDLEDDDIEIWFLQAPANANLSQFENQTVSLEGRTKFLPDDTGKTFECAALPYDSNQKNMYNVILPRKNDGQLGFVSKKLAGHIVLNETIDVPEYLFPTNIAKEGMEKPQNLKQRHVIFGSKSMDEIFQSMPKKSISTESHSSEHFQDSIIPKKSHKKKKKSKNTMTSFEDCIIKQEKIDESDIQPQFQDVAENEITQKVKKKKLKKIKTEKFD